MKLFKKLVILFVLSICFILTCCDSNISNNNNDNTNNNINNEIVEKKYKVTFVDYDGTILKEEMVKEGGKATPPPFPTKEGYYFARWDNYYTDIKKDTIITAIYEDTMFEMSFDSNLQVYTINGLKQSIDRSEPLEITIPSYYNNFPVSVSVFPLFRGEDNIVKITFTENIKDFGGSSLMYCSGLTAFEVVEENPYYKSIDGVLFSKDGKTLLAYPVGKKEKDYNIPEGVETLRSCLFQQCQYLTSITLSSTVKTIEDGVFEDCDNLVNIYVDENNPYYKSVDGNLYLKDGKTLIRYATGKKDNHFTIPNEVESLGKSVFDSCKNLKSIYIPKNVTLFDINTFDDVNNYVIYFESNEIPSNLANVTENLNDVYVGISRSNLIQVDDLQYVLDLNNNTATISKYIGSSDSILIKESIIHNNQSYTITTIGNDAFINCENLEEVIFDDSSKITGLGYRAFYNCINLKNIELPRGISVIKSKTFYNCKSLTTFNFSTNIKNIKQEAFYNCENLMYVKIPKNIIEVAFRSFQNCYKLVFYIEMPSTNGVMYNLYEGACAIFGINESNFIEINGLQYKLNLENNTATLTKFVGNESDVKIPRTITHLGRVYDVVAISGNAFRDTQHLKSVIIPDCVKTMWSHVFTDNPNLIIYCEAESEPSGWFATWNSFGGQIVWNYKYE